MAKRNTFSTYTDLGFWGSKLLLNHLPFVLFLGFLTMIYIANAHLAERNVRTIQVLQKEIKEMRWHYLSIQSENMYNSQRTEVAKKVKDMGLRSLNERPKRLIVKEE